MDKAKRVLAPVVIRWSWGAATATLLLVAGIAFASTPAVPTYLRQWGGIGSGNGQFENLHGIAVDPAGNVYAADAANNRIQKFSSDGTFVTAWGTSGSGDGQLDGPFDVAVDQAYNVYVADMNNNRIQKFTDTGAFLAKWGSNGGGLGEFRFPGGVAVDSSGNVYVADSWNHRAQKFDGAGNLLAIWGGGPGDGDGFLNFPYGIAVDAANNVYVADSENDRIQKFDDAGLFLAKWGTAGSGPGQFQHPWQLDVDRAGNVYVTDLGNRRVQKFSDSGVFLGAWEDGPLNNQFYDPVGIAVSPLGSVYVADNSYRKILQFALARMIVGVGNGGDGMAEDMATMAPHGLLSWQQVAWAAYNGAGGETRPALCDVDGDLKDELVLGLGPGGNGWLQVKDDPDTGFAQLAWIQVNWAAYNSANGETWPACGDIDGDGRDEIVVGLGNGGKGWARLYDDAGTGFAPMPGTPMNGGWVQLPWAVYNNADGSVHPAVGNLDGDPREEIVFALGPGSDGWVHIRDDQMTGFANLAGTPGAGGWLQFGWLVYQAANGTTWPAVGDLDGDGDSELVLGLGTGGDGWLRVFQDASGGFAPAAGTPGAGGWLRIEWSAYNTAVGASFPAIGDLDGDGAAELLIGLGTYTTSGGWVEIRESILDGLGHQAWARIPWTTYNNANGLTRPAMSR
jgi:DNA-binding beta-propeller fold protein YncE